jgi:hypothetical protein
MIVGTIVSAFAAAGALIFTGIVTYYDVQVARDQLEQSQEDAEKDAKRQAALVGFWQERPPDSSLIFYNRSTDPLYNVHLKFGAGLGTDDDRRYEVYLQSLTPCTQVRLTEEFARALDSRPGVGLSSPYSILFTDMNGETWERAEDEGAYGAVQLRSVKAPPSRADGVIYAASQIEYKQVDNCGAGATDGKSSPTG